MFGCMIIGSFCYWARTCSYTSGHVLDQGSGKLSRML